MFLFLSRYEYTSLLLLSLIFERGLDSINSKSSRVLTNSSSVESIIDFIDRESDGIGDTLIFILSIESRSGANVTESVVSANIQFSG